MFNGIRSPNPAGLGRWHCYDTDIHCLYWFDDGQLYMVMHLHRPNPAGGWYRLEIARM